MVKAIIIVYLLFIFILPLSGYGQNNDSNQPILYNISVDSKDGFINKYGEVVIAPQEYDFYGFHP